MKKSYSCLVCIILIFMCSFVQAATVDNFKNVTEKAQKVIVVEKGTVVEYKNTSAKLTVSNPQIAVVEGNKLKIADSGRFKVTVSIEGQESTKSFEFFAWNAYLKSGKFWTYEDAKKSDKAAVVYARTYFDLSKASSKVFLVDDYIFKTGTYNGELKGKYLTSYYDEANDKSTSKYYEYAMKADFSVIEEPIVSVPVEEISLTVDNTQMTVGDVKKIGVNIKPENATDKTLTFKSSNSKVIKVMEDNSLLAAGIGTADVVIKSSNGVAAKCTLSVKAKPIEKEPEVTVPVVPEPEVTIPVVPEDNSTKPAEPVPEMPKPAEKMEIHFINPNSRVDAVYIEVGDKSMFIDGGFYRDAKSEIAYLKKIGVTHIDYYIGSHAHSNHVGAAGPIIKEFGIKTIYVGPAKYNGKNSAMYMMNNKAETKAEEAAIAACKVEVLNPGDKLEINGLKIQCLGPIKLTKTAPGKTAENKNSVILRMDFGEVSFLTAGDTGRTQLREAAKKYPGMLDVDIYKNSHHNGSMKEDVIKMISPDYVVFTTKDGYLPSSSYLKLLKKYDAKYYMATNKKDGNVVITTDGTNISVKTKN